MSLMSPVFAFPMIFISIVSFDFLIYCIFCHWTNHILSVLSLTMVVLNPDPLVCTVFANFLSILTILLVVLVFWGLAFLYQQELSPDVIFLRFLCSYQ